MGSLAPYLFFNNNCREAMNFYKSCLGGELYIMTFADAQGEACPPAMKNQVMHAALKRSDLLLMASDTPDQPPKEANNIQLSLTCSSQSEIETVFTALSKNGKVRQPLHNAFWGAVFGMLTDQYGFHWMLNFEKPKA